MLTAVKGLLLDDLSSDAKTKQYADDDRKYHQHDAYLPV